MASNTTWKMLDGLPDVGEHNYIIKVDAIKVYILQYVDYHAL